MKAVTTGELNQAIEILSKQVMHNEFGGGTDEFIPYWNTYAKAVPLSSSRTLEANQSQLKMVVEFTVRARNDKEIFNDMLVKWRGMTLIVQNYVPDPTYKEFNVFKASMANAGDIMDRPVTT